MQNIQEMNMFITINILLGIVSNLLLQVTKNI